MQEEEEEEHCFSPKLAGEGEGRSGISAPTASSGFHLLSPERERGGESNKLSNQQTPNKQIQGKGETESNPSIASNGLFEANLARGHRYTCDTGHKMAGGIILIAAFKVTEGGA